MLYNKKIILGVSGGIAAYKSAQIVRELVKREAEVQVLMTASAKEFITPLTMATLSKRPILIDFFDPTNGQWNSHVNLGLWADAFLIAPATANTIGKMANGIADNLLLTTYLSAKCPVFVAPSMDLDMYKHPATQNNLDTLQKNRCLIIKPTSGFLASGLNGMGRMQEPDKIVDFIDDFFIEKKQLTGKKILITAGPTYEKIDPVRFIGNYSTGKMGFALANACAECGAEVVLISGPVTLQTEHRAIRRINVESAEEMYIAAKSEFDNVDGAILCAAVADFTPVKQADKKIKKQSDGLQLTLKPTHDIAAELGKKKKNNQFLVGFALETDNAEMHALEKLKNKNFDFIVLNSLQNKETCFGYDTNQITILRKDGTQQDFSLKNKTDVAMDIVDEIISNNLHA